MKYTLALACTLTTTLAAYCPVPPPASSTTPSPSSTAPTPSSTPSAPTGPNYFGVMSARSASPVHLLPLTARGQKFYLGGPGPSSYCPVEQVGSACPNGTSTVFAGGDPTLSLGVVVPGGQQVYVAADGALGYTQAHSAYVPAGAIRDGFSLVAPGANGLGQLEFDTGFVACPAGEGQGYQVFGQVQGATFGSECLGFDALTVAASGPGAWQY